MADDLEDQTLIEALFRLEIEVNELIHKLEDTILPAINAFCDAMERLLSHED